MNNKCGGSEGSGSLVPRPPLFFVLQFVFSITMEEEEQRKCFAALPLPYVILNANQREKKKTKKQERPGNEAKVEGVGE